MNQLRSYSVVDTEDPENCIKGCIIGGNTDHRTKERLYYTFDGELVDRSTDDHDIWHEEAKLDSCAPKPQPVRSKIQYWEAIGVGLGMTKGVPGWFILFFDKNGNKIDSYRYDMDKKQIITCYYKDDNEKNCYSGLDFDISKPTEISQVKILNV